MSGTSFGGTLLCMLLQQVVVQVLNGDRVARVRRYEKTKSQLLLSHLTSASRWPLTNSYVTRMVSYG